MNTEVTSPKKLTELPYKLPGRIFRSPMPFGPFDPDREVFRRYQAEGVDTVLVLAEDSEMLKKTGRDLRAFYTTEGLDMLHYPIQDFDVPDNEAINAAVEAVLKRARGGHNVAVHCNAGVGRTGLFMACLAKRHLGLNGWDAIQWVRKYIPDALENFEQEQFVIAF